MIIQEFKIGMENSIAKIHNSGFEEAKIKYGSLYGYIDITPRNVLQWIKEGEKHPNNKIWVISDDSKPDDLIGYAHISVSKLNGTNNQSIYSLVINETLESLGQSKFVIHPKYQRNGYGTFFLKSLIEYYSQKKVDIGLVLAYNKNIPATKMLSRLGFQQKKQFFYSKFSPTVQYANNSVLAKLNLENPIIIFPSKVPVNVRKINDDDLDDILEIVKLSRPDLFEGNPKHHDISKWYNSKWAELTLVAEIENPPHNRVVGCMEFSAKGIIGILGVLPSYSKQGIGGFLFGHLLKEMQVQGISVALADTGWIYEPAIKMYEKYGFNIQHELYSWVKILK